VSKSTLLCGDRTQENAYTNQFGWHPEGTRGVPMEGAPPIANQIDLFMHFLGASRDGLVARRVDLDMISSSGRIEQINKDKPKQSQHVTGWTWKE
jgi:hypothetical protein